MDSFDSLGITPDTMIQSLTGLGFMESLNKPGLWVVDIEETKIYCDFRRGYMSIYAFRDNQRMDPDDFRIVRELKMMEDAQRSHTLLKFGLDPETYEKVDK